MNRPRLHARWRRPTHPPRFWASPLRRLASLVAPAQARRWALRLTPALLAATTLPSLAQLAGKEEDFETKWARLAIYDPYVSLESEGSVEEARTKDQPGSYHRERYYLIPMVGMGFRGSLYHPNLVKYDLHGEGGMGVESIQSSSESRPSQLSYLQRYHADVSFLDQKPYAFGAFAERDQNFRDYDFFNRVKVDDTLYGGRAGLGAGPIPFHLRVSHLDEDVTETLLPSQRAETTLSLSASHLRDWGDTSLTYSLTDYDRRYSTGSDTVPWVSDAGLYQNLSLSDGSRFGHQDQFRLLTTFTYDSVGSTNLASSTFNWRESLTWDHSPTLRSFYDYGLSRQQIGDSDTLSNQGKASLRHQLYESLTSEIEFHGLTTESSSPGSSVDITRYGPGLNFNYKKHLGRVGVMSLSESLSYDFTDQQVGGSLATIRGERHTLQGTVPVSLNLPNALRSSLVVQDETGVRTYLEGIDYVVFPGVFLQIQRTGPLSGILDGDSVRLNYDAQSQPSGQYDTLNNIVQLRLDFLRNLFGVFGRLRLMENYGGSQFVLENLWERVAGADFNWRWVRLGGEYDDYDSSLTPFVAKRLFQNFNFPVSSRSLFTVDFSQAWTSYAKQQRHDDQYQFIGRYRHRFSPTLAASLESGYRMERGEGVDQDLVTARFDLEYARGKLSVKLGYEYQDYQFLGEMRERNYFYLRAKRRF